MGHCVTGFIVETSAAQDLSAEHPRLRPIALEHGLVLFPLTSELLDSMFAPGQAHPFAAFTHLCADLTNLLMKRSIRSRILYFETDYHGGLGTQAAILFGGGHVEFGPKQQSNNNKPTPISEALGLMGIRGESAEVDAFEAVGLSRFRYTEDWNDAAFE